VIGEIEVGGIFIPLALIEGAIAFVMSLVLRRVLRGIRFYSVVWHAGLFDVATFVTIWWFVAYIGGNLKI
jgi:hypothetical protein